MKSNDLNAFLNLYWLRPENAVLAAIQTTALKNYPVDGLSLDMSCGDGTFTFIAMGGQFHEDFDIFMSTTHLEKVHVKHADMFDYFSSQYKPMVVKDPNQQVDYCIDIKESMINKAKSLPLYKNHLVHDCTKGLPFPDGHFDTIYFLSSINHYTKIDVLLSELYRVLSSSGKIYLSTYSPVFLEFYRELEKVYPPGWVSVIERGMRNIWPTMMEMKEWMEVFTRQGLKVRDIQSLVSRDFIPVWNVGLRPIAPFTVKMSNALRSYNIELLREIKHEWVSFFYEMALPFYEKEVMVDVEKAGIHLFIMEK